MTTLFRDTITKPIHKWARRALPQLSQTEAEALKSGDVWWDADLFSGNPDWSSLLETPRPHLGEAEQAFLDGPCVELCAMVDDWQVNHHTADLPEKAWAFMAEKKFFGMIIPQSHGGLGFSAFGHSEIIRFLSTRSITAAVTVMVPNSLGPGELIMQFGTDTQKDYWLPRLAEGRELPAFGLTSEQAGSDAAAMIDSGVVCKGKWKGKDALGIRLNWSKRYITLSPVCTVLGLAFKLSDPDHLMGEREDLGITCALVPTSLPGVETGRRHIPSGTMFHNGPTTGKDVFIPLDHIIGGPDYAGRGWMMLMSALAAGRGISLPSLSCAAIALAAHSTGAYARIRQQFGIPIGKFGGVQQPMGRLAARAYATDAARQLTCAGLDGGRKLAVISGIMKAHATYRMRDAINDAMDVHSGKSVIDGPKNYLSPIYRAVPVGITVEGANILTRNLIIFGQGSIRCHPHLLDEMEALEIEDDKASLQAFHDSFWAHVRHALATLGRAWVRSWSGGLIGTAPKDAGQTASIYKQMSRWSAALALTSDMAFLSLGAALKRKEMLSARLGDVLSELYLLSGVLKRFEDEGRQQADLPLVQYAAAEGFANMARSLSEVLDNWPARPVAWLLRFILLPGRPKAPNDRITEKCADLIYEPSDTRQRIVSKAFAGSPVIGIAALNEAYARVCANDGIRRRVDKAGISLEEAVREGMISEDEARDLRETDDLIAKVVAVDDFTPDELAGLFTEYTHPDKKRSAKTDPGKKQKDAAE